MIINSNDYWIYYINAGYDFGVWRDWHVRYMGAENYDIHKVDV